MLFVTDTPIVHAYPDLAQERRLATSELNGFSIMVEAEARGPLDAAVGAPTGLLRSHLSTVDARLERVIAQQYFRLAVLRRDASFELCGCHGTLVLSGNGLLGSTTAEALRPIRRRQILWLVLWLVALVGTFVFLSSALHQAKYFATTNRLIFVLAMVAILSAIPALGIGLREWRKGAKLARLTLLEKVALAGALVPALAAALISALASPRVTQATEALASNDVGRARVVLDALLATRGSDADVLAVQDNVELAEAANLGGDAKLELLDRIATRKGAKASEAAQQARSTRISWVNQLLNTGDPTRAIKTLERWFGNQTTSDKELANLRAIAEDKLFASCSDERCRFASSLRATMVSPNAERSARLAASKAKLVESLKFPVVPNEPVAGRLQRLRLLAMGAGAARDSATGDTDVLAAADEAAKFANAERGRVAVIGAQEAAVAELLGPLTNTTKTIARATQDTTSIFVVFDPQRRCRGLYAVGPQPKSRIIPTSTVNQLLSQAFGRPITLKPPTRPGTPSRWFENGVPIIARWSGSNPVELRIGDAAP